jgi:hypothetical protein
MRNANSVAVAAAAALEGGVSTSLGSPAFLVAALAALAALEGAEAAAAAVCTKGIDRSEICRDVEKSHICRYADMPTDFKSVDLLMQKTWTANREAP